MKTIMTPSQVTQPQAPHPRRHISIAWILPLLALALPSVVQAQYACVTNNGRICITRYTGSGGVVSIPSAINGWPVTSIGDYAFYNCDSLTRVTIPLTVTSIGIAAFAACPNLANVTLPNTVNGMGDHAFSSCTSLTSIALPNTLTRIDSQMFYGCTSLTNVIIPNSVTRITDAFWDCSSLPSIIIPDSVTRIEDCAFSGCTSLTNAIFGSSVSSIGAEAFAYCSLTSITLPQSLTNIGNYAFEGFSLKQAYFKGNAPSIGWEVFAGAENVVYYLPGTTGWGTTFSERPTVLWVPRVQASDSSSGIRTNQFRFTITWASGRVVVVEASTTPGSPVWHGLATNTLSQDSFYFSDPQWTNYPARFYRVRSP